MLTASRVDLGEPGQRTEISSLAQSVAAATGRPALSEHKQIGLDTARHGSIGLVVRDEAGSPIGYVQLEHDGEGFAAELVVDASLAGPDALVVAGTLLDVATATARAEGGGMFQLFSLDPGIAALAVSLGLDPNRALLQLRRPLPLPQDDRPPLPVRPFEVGRDEDAWVLLNARSFADHPDQGSWDRSTLEEREHQPWFSAAGFLLHERDGRLAGACWTKVHTEPEHLGEIYVIGVDPDFQGLGIGRGLVVAGLEHLASIGVPTAMLYVEEDNPPALGLYRALGFTTFTREVVYVGSLGAP